jgi:membrane associated rhomboid family serine protease
MNAGFNEQWLDLLPTLAETLPQQAQSEERIWEWSLVLTAMGIEHQVGRSRPGLALMVRPRDQRRAEEEIQAFEQENSLEAEADSQDRLLGSIEPTVWALLALAAFFKAVRLKISLLGYDDVPWQQLGSVEAWAVMHGEWWRVLTGLTLHGDVPHLVSNMLVGFVFIAMLCRELGSGLGWFLVLLAGALGNGCNVLMQGPPHDSIGFSTSVFGCVGLLAGLRSVERSRHDGARRYLPIAAALGLLALLGTGGENTDLGAHLLGLVCGFPLGLMAAGLTAERFQSVRRLNGWFGAAAGASIPLCWAVALLNSSPLFQ